MAELQRDREAMALRVLVQLSNACGPKGLAQATVPLPGWIDIQRTTPSYPESRPRKEQSNSFYLIKID